MPEPVRDWRSRLKECDGVLICTPKYVYGVPGVLKNAFDWIVSSGEFMDKPTAVISTSPSPDGGAQANASLVQTLRVMMAEIVKVARLLIPTVSAKLNDKAEMRSWRKFSEVTNPATKPETKQSSANLVY